MLPEPTNINQSFKQDKLGSVQTVLVIRLLTEFVWGVGDIRLLDGDSLTLENVFGAPAVEHYERSNILSIMTFRCQ